MTDPAQIMVRLEEIEQALAARQNEYEQAADARARHLRSWEKRLKRAMIQAKGPNADHRNAAAFVTALETDEGSLFDQLSDAEARYDACRVATKVDETRATIGMAILKAQGRA